MITRRQIFQILAVWPALAMARTTKAQSKAPVMIGWLNSSARATNLFALNAFNEGMAALGWKFGAQYVVEERWADGRVERLPALAREVAAKQPAVIVAVPTRAARAASLAASTIPVVLASGDPMQTGLIKSLARPGGMVTGLSNINNEISEKTVELLMQSLPGLKRVGFFADASSASHSENLRTARGAAEHYRLEPVFRNLTRPEEIEPAITYLAKEKVQALVLLASGWFSAYREQILKLALTQRWPVAGNQSPFVESGALLSYGADRVALYRRSAYFVDRILRGAKAADLPVEQPTKFETAVNLKTARLLGLAIPQTVLVRADRIIE